jgi:dsRNA-specific ribonuclease
MQTSDHFEIEKKLEYEFRSKQLLDEALRHSSFVNEQPDADLRDNERFEFLGDAVLNLIVGHILMERYPNLKEGDLSRIRANLVNESQLAINTRALLIWVPLFDWVKAKSKPTEEIKTPYWRGHLKP